MTAVALNQTLNKIPSLASKFSSSLTPFFFVKQNSFNNLLKNVNVTLKINRYMSPFLTQFTDNVRFGFWSLAQVQEAKIQQKALQNSIVINPFKTQKLIRNCLTKGISKLMVSDIQELIKIQELYFKLKKQGLKVNQPEYIWSIENLECDTKNVIDLQNCDLPINGLYFSKDLNMHEINKFMQNKQIKQKNFINFRETIIQDLNAEGQFLKANGIQPLITNYSQTSNYLMVCRVIGKDREGKPVFDPSCLDFTCNSDVCHCANPALRIQNTFFTEGKQWAIIRPARIDKLRSEYIKQ